MSTMSMAPPHMNALAAPTAVVAPMAPQSDGLPRAGIIQPKQQLSGAAPPRSRKRLSWSLIEPTTCTDGGETSGSCQNRKEAQQARKDTEITPDSSGLKKSTGRLAAKSEHPAAKKKQHPMVSSATARRNRNCTASHSETLSCPIAAARHAAMIRSMSFTNGTGANSDCLSGVAAVPSDGEEAILANCEGAAPQQDYDHEHGRQFKRVKSEPTIASLEEAALACGGDLDALAALLHTDQPSEGSADADDGAFFIGSDDASQDTEHSATPEEDLTAASAPEEHKPLEPKFGVPPHPSTCDPSLDPDTFVARLVEAYLGYTPQIRAALALPETFLPPLDELHVASYGVEVVSAVRENNLEAVRALHRAGRPLACCNRFGESLLHMACRRGYTSVFQYLLNEARVSQRIRDDCGRTPLHDACWNREPQYEIVDELLQRDPSLLLVADKRGHTPFAYARREHWGVWRQFLSDRVQYIVRGLDRTEERQIFGGCGAVE